MVGGIPSTILGRPFNRKRMGNGVRPCAAGSGPVVINICLSQYKEATAGGIPERRRTGTDEAFSPIFHPTPPTHAKNRHGGKARNGAN
jgi:hypothetical protein